MSAFPQWCFVCARQARDNACGHLDGPIPCRGSEDCPCNDCYEEIER